jgi:hypothetical protein
MMHNRQAMKSGKPYPLRFAQEEHGASRSDRRGCSGTTRRVGVAQEADLQCAPDNGGALAAPNFVFEKQKKG